METKVLLAKTALGLLGLLALSLLLAWRRLFALAPRRFDMLACAGLLATRLGLFAAVFLVLRLPAHADVVIYHQQAHAALGGAMPYRDFPCHYAPLFPFIGALAAWFWDAPQSLILLAIGCETVAFGVWLAVGRALAGDRTARVAAVLYATSPLALVNVALDGQNQVWIALLLALSFFLLLRGRALGAGAAAGATIAAVKFLPLVFLPALALGVGPDWRRAARWALGYLLLPALAYGALVWSGVDVLAPLHGERDEITSGNAPFLFGALTGRALPARLADAFTLSLLAAAWLSVVVAVRRQQRLRPTVATSPLRNAATIAGALFLCVLVLLVLLVASKKAFTNYLVMLLFPLCLTVVVAAAGADADRGRDDSQLLPRGRMPRLVGFGVFGALAVLEPSVWYSWFDHAAPAALRSSAGGGDSLKLALFLGCDALLLLFYLAYARLAWKLARQERTGDEVRVSPASGLINQSAPSRPASPSR